MTFQIALQILATISFLLLLLATAKFYRNAKVIDTPNNFVERLTRLEKAVTGHKSNLVTLEGRLLNKTERIHEDGFRQLHSDVHRLTETSIQVQKRLLEALMASNKNVTDIETQISALRQHATEQQALLNRFQQGYDYTLNKSLIMGLIKAIDAADAQLESSSDSESQEAVNELRDILLVALESQNVDQFAPPVGADYKEHRKEAKGVVQESEDVAQIGKIAAVLEAGYKYVAGETERIIKPAVVAVYVAHSDDQKEAGE